MFRAIDGEELAIGAAHLGHGAHVSDQYAFLIRRDDDVIQEGRRGGEGGRASEEGLLALGVDGPDLVEVSRDELVANVDDALRIIEAFAKDGHFVAVDLRNLAVAVAELARGAHQGDEVFSTEALGDALGRGAHGEVTLHGYDHGGGGGFLGLAADEGEASEKGEDGGLHKTLISKLPPSGVKRSADDQPDRRKGREPGQHGFERVLGDVLQYLPAEDDTGDDTRQKDQVGHQ